MIKKIIAKERIKPGLLSFIINDYYLIRNELNKQILEKAPELKGILLDFGCGSKPYKDYFTNTSQYIGVDLKIPGWEFRQTTVDFFYDGKTIPFEDNHFDSMLCTEVLEHVYNIEELLTEFQRVLKPGGVALVTTPFMWEEHEVPHDFGRYTTSALHYLYKKHGFEIVYHHKTGNTIKVIMQFKLQYIKSLLPNNKIIRQILMLPFIFYCNTIATVFGFIFPGNGTIYFNNVFMIQKK